MVPHRGVQLCRLDKFVAKVNVRQQFPRVADGGIRLTGCGADLLARRQRRQGIQRLGRLCGCTAAPVTNHGGNRIEPVFGHCLFQVRRPVLVVTETILVDRIVRRAEVFLQGAKFAKCRAVSGDPPQILVPGAGRAGPMGEADRGDVIHVHRFAQLNSQVQERLGLGCVQRHSGNRGDWGPVAALPAHLDLGAFRNHAFFECGVQGGVKPQLCQDLGQAGRQAKPAAAKHFGTPAEGLLMGGKPPLQLSQQRLARQQRGASLAVLAPDQPHAFRLQSGLEQFQRRGLLVCHFRQQFARQQQIARACLAQLAAQRLSQRRGSQHGHIQQVSFARVIMIAFSRQEVERRGQTRSSLVRFIVDCGGGGCDNVALEVDFVQVAGVPQFSRQELDLQEAIAQRQEIGNQRLGGGRNRPFQRSHGQFDDSGSVQLAGNQAGGL